LRSGYVIGLNNSKRIKNNNKSKYNAANPLRVKHTDTIDEKIKWEYEGHSDDSDAEKLKAKQTRKNNNYLCRYTRGLRVCPDEGALLKIVDRDFCGCYGILNIWRAMRVEGAHLPDAYNPKATKNKNSTPVLNQTVEAGKRHNGNCITKPKLSMNSNA